MSDQPIIIITGDDDLSLVNALVTGLAMARSAIVTNQDPLAEVDRMLAVYSEHFRPNGIGGEENE